MKVLTATAFSQSYRKNDFNHCIEGELVWIGLICATDRANPDGGCGCGRSFAGLTSRRATTTAMVRDLPALTPDSYLDTLRGGIVAQGWPAEAADELAFFLGDFADDLPVGAVAERRLDTVSVRRGPNLPYRPPR
ncbi:DUF7715 domain-containing protein [Frankia sp. AiPs1]|uniref:DUF7715 family protein n=1 Tax=Frankia sp. AiPa1 TaxID=573492 RepID=UPI00202ACF06|nr:hypothetical protein [Frankia sp. AiPa1]MCL9758572.1 hypothetical protein [Frankia sp. AiPa1]